MNPPGFTPDAPELEIITPLSFLLITESALYVLLCIVALQSQYDNNGANGNLSSLLFF